MKREEILKTAKSCVCGERDEDYGKPEDNFFRIASYWSVYLNHPVTPRDVAMMMILLKVARTNLGGTDDCYVDIAGYAACAGEIYNGGENI